jgi:DivIVA domain-containing protein
MKTILDAIHHTEFRLALRGYAVEEIDAFLDELVTLASRDGSPDDDSGPPDGAERALRMLRLAEETAGRVISEATAEAAAAVAAGREQGQALLQASREQAARLVEESMLRLRQDVQALEQHCHDLRTQFGRPPEPGLGQL